MHKRILFITHLYPPSIGGAEKVFHNLAEGFAKRGHEITVLTSDATSTEQYFKKIDHHLSEDEFVNNVHIIRESLNSKIYALVKPLTITFKLGRFSFPWKPIIFGPHFYGKFLHILKEKFDVVIAGATPTSAIFYAYLYKRKWPQSKLVIFPHFHIDDRLHKSISNIKIFKKADHVLSLTNVEMEYIRSRGVSPAIIVRVINGIDDILVNQEITQTKENNYVLFLGQEGHHKNIPLLIKSMVCLWDRGYGNKLIIAGGRTNSSPAIDELINDLPPKYRANITRLNNITDNEKVRLLDNCLFVVNPSSYEAFGIVFIESWARKKPVIGSDIRAVKEIIQDRENGLLFKDKNAESLTEKIRYLLDNPVDAKKMGDRGYQKTINTYLWEKIIDKLEKDLGI